MRLHRDTTSVVIAARPEGNKMATYKIVRMYFNSDIPKRTVKTRLTLEEAQAHCNDPETSSRTCTKAVNKRRTKACGAWFDGYTEE